MSRRAFLLTAAAVVLSPSAAWSLDQPPTPAQKLPDGVYAVQRDSANEKDVLPIKDGEVLAVNRQRFLKADAKEPPRYLVVHAVPEVPLDISGEPKADKDGEEVVRIQLKLQAKAAAALERLTRARPGKQVAIVIDGEVVTVHKVREVIPNGDVQITSCSPGGATYLMKRLQERNKGN